VPITPFLRGRAFDPETIEVMSEAFKEVCRAIGLKERDDKMTALVARQIIQLAERGVRTKTELYLLTIKQFKGNPR
jgi:hypothetical protein